MDSEIKRDDISEAVELIDGDLRSSVKLELYRNESEVIDDGRRRDMTRAD